MRKVLERMRQYWKVNLMAFLISLGIGAIIFCLFYFLNNQTIVSAVNGAAVGAVVVFSLGVLSWLAHLGAFDTFSFGFKQLGSMIFARDARRDGSFPEYKENKRLKREETSYYFLSMLLAAIVLSIVLIVLEIVYNSKIY